MKSDRASNSLRRSTLGSPPLVTQQRPMWELVKEYIEDQIAVGTYPVGSWLPSVRELASQMGLNRNTISKAYRALGREKVVISKPGVGVLVQRRPNGSRQAEEPLNSQIATLVEQALHSGIAFDTLIQLVESEIERVSQAQQVKVAFIECSLPDTEKMSEHLSGHLDLHVDPLELNDFLLYSAKYARDYDILATTFFHLQEVTAAVVDLDVEVVGLHHVPAHESILELARLPSTWTIGLICTNDRTMEKVSRVIRMYTRCEIMSCILDHNEDVRGVLVQADVLVDTVRAHEMVACRADGLPSITLDFQTEPQSIEYLKSRISDAYAASPSAHKGGMQTAQR